MITLACWIIALAIAIPLGMFVLECVASLFYKEPEVSIDKASINKDSETEIPCAVLIPAHNEEAVLLNTLQALKPQLGAQDQIVVVADNCNDQTAAIAIQAGCTVLERFDDSQRGKGFALAHGIDYLREDPPSVVIIVDADCEAQPGSIELLKHAAVQYERTVQSSYLLKAPSDAALPIKVSEFAVLVKNEVRAKGASRLGMAIPLLGSGMAFPWADIADISIASGEIVEDMKLGIELAAEEKGALFLNQARVVSKLPATKEALASQRERWEHGHMGMIQKFSQPLLNAAWSKKSLPIFAFWLDLVIPPLSLLLILSVAVVIGFTLLGLFIDLAGASQLIAQMVLAVIVTVLVIWATIGRKILAPSELMALPMYALSKLGIYSGFFNKKQTEWKRTDRE